jgi:hypothetical protein
VLDSLFAVTLNVALEMVSGGEAQHQWEA